MLSKPGSCLAEQSVEGGFGWKGGREERMDGWREVVEVSCFVKCHTAVRVVMNLSTFCLVSCE